MPTDGIDRLSAREQASASRKPNNVPLLVTRQSPRPPFGRPLGLPIPTFSQSGGAVAYGTRVRLQVPNLPAGVTLEYSSDGGKTWTAGANVPVTATGTLLGRTRINDLTSDPTQANFTIYFRRMLVIGNSIMAHAPAPDLGWYNSNGMAASAPENDFVHLLTARLAALNPAIGVKLQSGGNFERGFGTPTYSLDEFNDPLKTFQPDLIVLRIGENVDDGAVLSRDLETNFRRLVERLTQYGQPVKVVCTTSVWYRPRTDAVFRKVAAEKTIPLADLRDMVDQGRYFASQYTNSIVAAHPNDAGMQRIADLLWAIIS